MARREAAVAKQKASPALEENPRARQGGSTATAGSGREFEAASEKLINGNVLLSSPQSAKDSGRYRDLSDAAAPAGDRGAGLKTRERV
jgi:hypothetical protein